MAQIFVFGYVGDPLIPKPCQTGTIRLCFHLIERIEKGQSQTYLVCAWGETAARLVRKSIAPGTQLWVTGSLRLVKPQRVAPASVLKIYLTNFGVLSRQGQSMSSKGAPHGMNTPPSTNPFPKIVDGEREPLPE